MVGVMRQPRTPPRCNAYSPTPLDPSAVRTGAEVHSNPQWPARNPPLVVVADSDGTDHTGVRGHWVAERSSWNPAIRLEVIAGSHDEGCYYRRSLCMLDTIRR